MNRIIAAAVAVIAGFLGITVMFGSWYTIDQGELGVVLRNGAVSSVAQPGLGFKLPIADSVVDISTRTQKRTWEKMESYSQDQQPAHVKVSINYRVDPSRVATLYSQFGPMYADAVLAPIVPKAFKIAFGKFTAIQAITDRARLNVEAEKYIRDDVAELSKGTLIVESTNVEDIKFSAAYEQSIEQRMLAEVEVSKLRQNAEREKVQAQIAVTQAQGRADAVRAEADATAYSIRARGDAEAYAVVQNGKAQATAFVEQVAALGRDPRVFVDVTAARRWDGKLPATMVPNGAVPFVSVGGK